MALPSGYTPLEYIESTGSQYVDTGVIGKTGITAEVEFEYTTLDSVNNILGSKNGDTRIYMPHYNAGFYFGYGAATNTKVTASAGTRYTIKTSILSGSQSMHINGKQVYTGTSTTTYNSNLSMYLMAMNESGSANYFAKGRTFASTIKENGTLIRDYVPCINASGTVGLYDMVNGTFGGDAAGVGFVAGPVAAQPEAPASLEVIGTTRNAAILAWPGAPVGQSYRLYRDGVVVCEGSALCYTDTGLAAGSVHAYSVHTLSGSTESDGVTAEATTTEGIMLITDRTAADVSAGRRKGYYNALDLIRVGEAMAYLEERFAAVGISVTVSPKLDWQISDIPTHIQALHYLKDLEVLRGKLMEFRGTVSLPGSLTTLTWRQANDIETILLDVENLIHTIILSYRHYTGRAISGVNALP